MAQWWFPYGRYDVQNSFQDVHDVLILDIFVTLIWSMHDHDSHGEGILGSLKQQRRQRKRYLKINIWEMMWLFFLTCYIFDRARCKWTGRGALDLLLCVHVVVKTLNLEIHTFIRETTVRQKIVLKCVLHVQLIIVIVFWHCAVVFAVVAAY